MLLIEDDASINDAFSILLGKEGYEVEIAFDGKEALSRLDTARPDIILLDLLMPVMDGKEFLKAFKNETNIPVIVFSNLDAKSDVQEALSLGATRYMLKAWASQKQLVKIIEETIAVPSRPSHRRVN